MRPVPVTIGEISIAPEHEELFYHEYGWPRLHWSGTYRGISFEIVRWDRSEKSKELGRQFDEEFNARHPEFAGVKTTTKSIMEMPTWNMYLYLWIDKIPSKYGPSSFWLEAVPLEMPVLPEVEGGTPVAEINRLAKKINRSNQKRKFERRIYRYSDHPILGDIEFHGGATYYEREIDDGYHRIKIGCDYMHAWDMERTENITVNMVIEDAKRAIDSVYKLMPEYGAEMEKSDE